MTTFLNLPGWDVLSVKQGVHDYRVEARYTAEPTACPHCYAQADLFEGVFYRHGAKEQLLMDLPSHGKRVGIVLKRPRYRCRRCGRTFPQPLPDVEERSSMTRRLVWYVEQESIRRTFLSIADEVGVHEKTVRNIFKRYVAWLDQYVRFETPEWLGLDEVHLLRRPRLVATNLKERTVVGVAPKRDKRTVAAYLSRLEGPGRVKVVVIDMWKPYRDAARVHLPRADVVVDKYHVVRMANQCLDAVRKTLRQGLTPGQCRRLMHDRYLLLRRERDLKPEQLLTRDDYLGRFPLLAEAYRAKEEFYRVYDAHDAKTAWSLFRAWEDGMSRELKAHYRPLLTAAYNWKPEVLAYFEHRATNACTEALNGIAKNINRNGRGYSFEAIRAKLLYSKTLQKERRPAYGVEPVTLEHDLPPGSQLDYLDHRDDLTQRPLLGTDIMALWAMLDPDSVVKANGNRHPRSTLGPRARPEDE